LVKHAAAALSALAVASGPHEYACMRLKTTLNGRRETGRKRRNERIEAAQPEISTNGEQAS
jgi:hypothetical protein